MLYQAILLTNAFTRRHRPAGFPLIAIICLLASIAASANAQATRPRIVPEKPQPSAANKLPQKIKPLTPKDRREAEQRLSDLGYWTGRIDGRWDTASRNALIAFQKVEQLKPNGQLTRATFDQLLLATRPTPRETGAAHIEVDLIRQVLFVVDDTGMVTRVLPVSTGNGKEFFSEGWARDAITHPGRYQVRQKIPGWKKSALGEMYYPVYFMYGTAIHGSKSVPTKPASHGCVRIPMFAAKEFYKITPVGMPVVIHKETTPKTTTPAEAVKQ
ncbi:MAG: L,D-transpeptidase family protein [Blastocatellia bacterium]